MKDCWKSVHLCVLGGISFLHIDIGGCGDALGEREGPGHGLGPLTPCSLTSDLVFLDGVKPFGLEVCSAMKLLL